MAPPVATTGDAGERETEMAKVIRTYELTPVDGRKSFYKKAIVRVYDDGTEVLRSYATDVLSRDANGVHHRHWDDWSATTGRHLASYAGICKKIWDKMEVEPIDGPHSYMASLIPDRIHL